MDWFNMSIFAMVSKKTRQFIIIENNERWKQICFHGIYDISFNYFCMKSFGAIQYQHIIFSCVFMFTRNNTYIQNGIFGIWSHCLF